jgi:hypothetical protein
MADPTVFHADDVTNEANGYGTEVTSVVTEADDITNEPNGSGVEAKAATVEVKELLSAEDKQVKAPAKAVAKKKS